MTLFFSFFFSLFLVSVPFSLRYLSSSSFFFGECVLVCARFGVKKEEANKWSVSELSVLVFARFGVKKKTKRWQNVHQHLLSSFRPFFVCCFRIIFRGSGGAEGARQRHHCLGDGGRAAYAQFISAE